MHLSVTSETTIRRAPSRKASNKAARLVRPIKEKSIVPCAPTLLEPPTCAPKALMLPMLLLGKPILRACFATWEVDFQLDNTSRIFTKFWTSYFLNFSYSFYKILNLVFINIFSLLLPCPPCPCLAKQIFGTLFATCVDFQILVKRIVLSRL